MDLADINRKIKNIKRHNTIQHELRESDVKSEPILQFIDWFNDALQHENNDPSAMTLATVDDKGIPDARVVLLKEIDDNKLIFYTNYNSKKANQLNHHPVAAVNFYWPNYVRQVRIRGHLNKVNPSKSSEYFATRPRESQISVYASMQSSIIASKDEIDAKMKFYSDQFSGKPIPCPEYWGGYELIPFEYEFFQARDWRIHDRLFYTLDNGKWKIVRLAP